MLGDNHIVAALHYPTSGKNLTGGGTEGLEGPLSVESRVSSAYWSMTPSRRLRSFAEPGLTYEIEPPNLEVRTFVQLFGS
jgi:hypothetical protein